MSQPDAAGHASQQGAWCWVLGASSGLGRAIAQRLVAEGKHVVLSARPGTRLSEAAHELGTPPAAEAAPLDVRERGATTALAARLMHRLGGPPEAAVFNGGGPPPSRLTDLGTDSLDAAYRLLLRPAYEFVAALAPAMRDRGRGVVIFLTSSGAVEPLAGLAASNIMRAGVTALAKTAAEEFGPGGVRVLCVAPGRIATDRVESLDAVTAARLGKSIDEVRQASEATIPTRRYGRPDEFAKVVAFLCSEDASYVTGTTVLVDGGKSKGLLT